MNVPVRPLELETEELSVAVRDYLRALERHCSDLRNSIRQLKRNNDGLHALTFGPDAELRRKPAGGGG